MDAAADAPVMEVLQDGPTDGVTAVAFLPNNNTSNNTDIPLLASTSWDGMVRLHEGTVRKVAQHLQAGPLLSLAVVSDHMLLIVGAANGSVQTFVPGTTPATTRIVGQHAQAVSCVGSATVNKKTFLVSASWDGTLKVWDDNNNNSSNSNSNSNSEPLATVELPGKAWSLDVRKDLVALVCAGRRLVVVQLSLDDNNVLQAKTVLNRESLLKFQARCVRWAGPAVATASIEGRVAVEYLEELKIPVYGKKYAFKCHRQGDQVFPVNCVAVVPQQNNTADHGDDKDASPPNIIFATGGCDGSVVTWDGLAKKKLATLHTFPTSIAALCFSPDGQSLAIASSYTFERGELPTNNDNSNSNNAPDEIYIRRLQPAEIAPKAKE